MHSFLLVLGCCLCAADVRGDAPRWHYVVPSPGDAHEHPPLRIIPLSTHKPEGLTESVRYRGARQRYAQIHYGSPSSVRVAIVLDEVSASDADLYVDTGRNRVIEGANRVKGESGVWRVPLDVAFVEDGKTVLESRVVLFRLGRVGRTLSYATCGYLEGRARLGGRDVAVRRADGDGNGFFADPQDRLWIDLNGDGRWDPVTEQFLFAPVLTLGGARYIVRSDPLGKRLTFQPMEGAGTLRLAVKDARLAGSVDEVSATLVGRDGSVVTLRGDGAEAILPVGDYRMSVLTLTLRDSAGGPPWQFVFSDSGSAAGRPWHRVAKGGTLVLDPVGQVTFLAGLADDADRCRPGRPLVVQPRLYTGDGLLINTASRAAEFIAGCHARVALTSTDGAEVANDSSGFA
jgi:hypothetical protein